MLEDTAQTIIPVRVRQAWALAEGIRAFEFKRDDDRELPAFTAGAHILVRVPNGEARRYSLCNDPTERYHYVIAVKREAGGRGGSVSLVDDTNVNDELLISEPRNDFELVGNPASYLFIAGGIGITPILSMIKQLQADNIRPFKLYYLCRSPGATAFRAELTSPRYRGRVVVHHDHGDPNQSIDLWPILEQPRGAYLYCCGPRMLMETVRDMTGHWPSAAVHFEDFGVSETARAVDNRPFTIRLVRSGATLEVPAHASVLEVLRANGYEIASSCESGTCGTCKLRLISGDPDHRDLVLTKYERSSNFMACVSRARSPELELDL
jgi:phthalate 4,5-dioxygenase reductase component